MSERRPLTGRCRCGHADWMHHDDAYMAGGKVTWGPCREPDCSCEGLRPEPTPVLLGEGPALGHIPDEVATLRAEVARLTEKANRYHEEIEHYRGERAALQSRLTAAEAERDAYQRECDSRRVSYDALREALADRDRQLAEARELLAWFVDEAEAFLREHFISRHYGHGERFTCNGISEEKRNVMRARIDAYRVAYRAAAGDK